MNEQTKRNVKMLLDVAREKIEAADQEGECELFTSIGEEFGPLAHRVFLSLDLPVRACENYHNRSMNRVLLDPYTVLNRYNSINGDSSATIDSPEFWNHGDMVKTLIDYLSLKYKDSEMLSEAHSNDLLNKPIDIQLDRNLQAFIQDEVRLPETHFINEGI